MKDKNVRECPFCAKLEAVIRKWGDTVESVCGYCGACGPVSATHEEALKLWNKRRRPLFAKK